MVIKIILVIAIVAVLVLLTRWTDEKGWTSFYKKANGGAMLSGAMMTFDQMLSEERKTAIEYRKEERADQTESGDTHS
jgi:hypothetical protein